MIDHLRQMAIFAKTIDHGSFRGAASELHLSASVVSHHISQLEEHLGVALIYRTTRKLTLTPEGTRLLTAAHKMMDAVEGELLELAVSAKAPSGELRLTIPSVLSQSNFTDQLAAFTQSYPRISLSLDYSDMRRELIADGFDVAIRMGPKPKRSSTSRTLFQTNRILVASTAYLQKKVTPQTPKDLLDWDWLALNPARNVPLDFRNQSGDRITIKPVARVSTNDAQANYRLARAGVGLAVVPQFLADADIATGHMNFVLPEWLLNPIDVFALWPANAPKHGLIHLLLGEIGSKTAPRLKVPKTGPP